MALNFESCIEEIDNASYTNHKFAMCRSQKTFVINNLEKCENPTEVLRECINYSINEAIKQSKNSGLNPDHLGATISSTLLNPDIYHPIRHINTNVADTLLNLFLKVSQSKTTDGSLLGEPFTLAITTIDKSKLSPSRKTCGRGPARKLKSKIPEKSLARIHNEENRFCLFFALEVMRIYISKGLTRQAFNKLLNNYLRMRTMVDTLMQNAQIPTNLPEYELETWGSVVQKYYDNLYGVNKYKIIVFNGFSRQPIYQSSMDKDALPILLYYYKNHFDGIRCIASFFRSKYFCLTCFSSYSNHYAHNSKCASRCVKCSGTGPGFPCKKIPEEEVFCNRCNKKFYSEKCYDNHINANFCQRSHFCSKCRVIYRTDAPHLCGHVFCNVCLEQHKKGEKCFIKPYEPQTNKPYRLITFDFEATQSLNLRISKRVHNVNFICAKVTCTNCIKEGSWDKPIQKECKLCGPHRTLTWAPFLSHNNRVDQHVATTDPLSSFTDWLLDFDPKYKTLAYSHYGGRYDCTFMFGEFVRQGIVPELIRQGNRIYQMKIEKTDENPQILFRDSFNFVPQKLDSLVDAFDLNIESKGYFPHLYNSPRNYNKTLYHLPPKRLYMVKSMKQKEKKDFEQWHYENYNKEFNLNNELSNYCENDVNILLHALIAMRNGFFDTSRRAGIHNGIDILYEAMTIASACMKLYRLNYLKPRHLGIVPERGLMQELIRVYWDCNF